MIGQNCLGRSSPEIVRVSGCRRVPSPPARITAHRWPRSSGSTFLFPLLRLVTVPSTELKLWLTSCSQEKIDIAALLYQVAGAVVFGPADSARFRSCPEYESAKTGIPFRE